MDPDMQGGRGETSSQASAFFGSQSSQMEFFVSTENKSIYEAEDIGFAKFPAGVYKHLPFRTVLRLRLRPVLYAIPSGGSENPVYERTLACPNRLGKPVAFSGELPRGERGLRQVACEGARRKTSRGWSNILLGTPPEGLEEPWVAGGETRFRALKLDSRRT